MMQILISLLVLTGCGAVLLAAVGLVRFPDFFTRTHAATKASAFGLGVLLVAVCLVFPALNVMAKAVFALVALFLTLPVASQALADAARGDETGDAVPAGEEHGASDRVGPLSETQADGRDSPGR